ncbi:MAG: PAS domain-containing protein [Victivallales bacterium]
MKKLVNVDKKLPVPIHFQSGGEQILEKINSGKQDGYVNDSSLVSLEAAKEWQHAIDAVEDTIFILGPDYRIMRCNKACLRMFNITDPGGGIIGRYCWEVVHGASSAPVSGCPLIVMRETKRRESAVIRMGERWLRATVDPPLDAGGDIAGLVHIICDITKSRLAEEEREKMESHVRQTQKMDTIGQLAGGIAHDFNNQLMGIMGCAEFVYGRLDDAGLKTEVENIIRASKRAADLTSKLLAFSWKGKYLAVSVDIHKLIGEVTAILEHSIDRRIEVRRELNADPAFVKGDPPQLQNALLNLAINARDALPNGGEIVFTTEIVRSEDVPCDEEKRLAAGGRYLKICVIDDGIGMDDGRQAICSNRFSLQNPWAREPGWDSRRSMGQSGAIMDSSMWVAVLGKARCAPCSSLFLRKGRNRRMPQEPLLCRPA